MKKIALTSLLAVFAAAGANAANTMDGNPLYMPGQNHFYSVTSLGSHSDGFSTWRLNEDFGYGITNKLAVNVSTTVVDEKSFNQWGWDEMAFGAKFRALDLGGQKADLVGGYAVDPFWGNHEPWLDKDYTNYTWTAGLRGGYVGAFWTVAGHALFNYENTESFNWNDEGRHFWNLGVDGQLLLGKHFSLLAGVEYTGFTDSWAHNAGSWSGELGVNYNFDPTKFIGLYATSGLQHKVNSSDWEIEDGFGFGAKFGIDF